MSTGLYYPPAKDAPTDEIIALAKPMRAYGGIHTTHMRDEASHLVESVNETIAIGKAADIPVVISHHKASGTPNHGLVEDDAEADRRGAQDASGSASTSTPTSPPRPCSTRAAFRSRARSSSPGRRAGRNLPARRSTRSRSSSAAAWNEAAEQLLPAGAIYFMMSEDDVRRVLAYPHTMIGSDGLPHDEHPHPRLWGTFPARARPLRARRQAVPARRGGAAHDRAAGGAVRAQRIAACCAPAPMPIWCCSIRQRSPTPRPSTAEDAGAPASSKCIVNGRIGLARRRRHRRPPRPRAAAAAARADGWRDGGGVVSISRWEMPAEPRPRSPAAARDRSSPQTSATACRSTASR